jgi:hypothetical protein
LAEERGLVTVTLCWPCLRAATGIEGPPRNIPGDPAREAEFEAALRQLKAEAN